MKVEDNLVRSFTQSLEGRTYDVGKEAIKQWKFASEQRLAQAAEERDSTGLYNIIDTFTDPVYDEISDTWRFSVEHHAAVYHEYGAPEHAIRARNAQFLAFEWPNAPEDVKEQFEHTEGDLVFFKKVKHPGIPATKFIRHGRAMAEAELRRADRREEEQSQQGGFVFDRDIEPGDAQ